MTNLTTRAPEEIIDDLGLAILAILPEEGSKLGKYLPDGKNSQQIKKELDDPYVTGMNIGRRLANLRHFGFVVGMRGSDAKAGHRWQRTPKGKAFLDKVSSRDGK